MKFECPDSEGEFSKNRADFVYVWGKIEICVWVQCERKVERDKGEWVTGQM